MFFCTPRHISSLLHTHARIRVIPESQLQPESYRHTGSRCKHSTCSWRVDRLVYFYGTSCLKDNFSVKGKHSCPTHAHAHGAPRFPAQADHSVAFVVHTGHRPALLVHSSDRHRARVPHGCGEGVSVHDDAHRDQGVGVGGCGGWRRRGNRLQTPEAVLSTDGARRQRKKRFARADIEPDDNVQIGCNGESESGKCRVCLG